VVNLLANLAISTGSSRVATGNIQSFLKTIALFPAKRDTIKAFYMETYKSTTIQPCSPRTLADGARKEVSISSSAMTKTFPYQLSNLLSTWKPIQFTTIAHESL
jgi:hypothetical protein